MTLPALFDGWIWFLAGAVLMILELAAPGAFLLWFGLAAIATGLVGLVTAFGWSSQLLVFVGFAVVFVLIGRRVMRRGPPVTDSPFLNRRADALVGRDFVLAEPIVNGVGRVRVDDSIWRVVGPDAAIGARVKAVRVDGSALVVEIT